MAWSQQVSYRSCTTVDVIPFVRKMHLAEKICFSEAQSIYLAMLLNPQVHFSYNCGII